MTARLTRLPLPFRWAINSAIGTLVLFALSGHLARAQEQPGATLHSPQATVRTFLLAVTMSRANPTMIKTAAACLDLSGLPRNQQNTGPLLATQLEAALRAWDVDTELIPDEPEGELYVLLDAPGRRIALARQPDKRWLFDTKTVTQIHTLYAEAQKHLLEMNKEAAVLNVAPDYSSARSTVRTMMLGYRRHDLTRLLGGLDLGDVPNVAREEVGTQTANKLKQVLLRQPRIILQEIPDSNYRDPFVWLSQAEGVIELVRIPSGPRKGEWVFSRDTVRTIDQLYAAYEDKPYTKEIVEMAGSYRHPSFWGEPELWLRNQLPGWLKISLVTTPSLNLEVYELLGYVLLPFLAYGVYRAGTWLLLACSQALLARRRWVLPADVLSKRLRPAACFAAFLFLRWGFLLLEPDTLVLVSVLMVLNPLLWLVGMWAIFRFIDLLNDLMDAHMTDRSRRPEISHMLWPVGSLAIKIGLFVMTLFHLMALFSWDITALLTGLGIGGLAFALGAQDSLKNLFGSFTLIIDRPFVVGEIVKIGSEDLGVVEVVGLRSTRIRTSDDTLLIVPNSNLTTMNIVNYGRRRYRRYQSRIGVVYNTTPQQLLAFREGIRKVIQKEERTRKDHMEVAVNDLGASAIEVLVNVYFEVTDRQQELQAREAFILDILRLADELKIDLAYPTQTIHVVPSEGEAKPADTSPAQKTTLAE
jgi:MscS family membrane protein